MSKQDVFDLLKKYPGVKFTSGNIAKTLEISNKTALRNLNGLVNDNQGIFKDAEFKKDNNRFYAHNVYWFQKI